MARRTKHGVELAFLVRNVDDDGVLQQPRVLDSSSVHLHAGQRRAPLRAFHRLVEPLDSGGDAEHHRNTRHALFAVDEPL